MAKKLDDTMLFDVDEFLDAISTHGQLVKYERATRCPCYNTDSGQPDRACPVCSKYSFNSQTGWIWKQIIRVDVPNEINPDCYKACPGAPSHDGKTLVTYTKNAPITAVRSVYNETTNILYNVVSFNGNTIHLGGGAPPKTTDRLHISYSYDATSRVIAENSYHNGSFVINTVNKNIYSVSAVRNASTGETYTIDQYNYDTIVISGELAPASNERIEVDYTYIQPTIALISSVSPMLNFTGSIGEMRMGDATLTVAPIMKIGYMDRFTLVQQEERESEVIVRGEDKLRYSEVIEVLSIFSRGDEEEVETEYFEHTDFEVRGSKIAWNACRGPIDTRRYSVLYTFRPVYMVYSSLPLVRTPQQKMQPRRAIIRRADVW